MSLIVLCDYEWSEGMHICGLEKGHTEDHECFCLGVREYEVHGEIKKQWCIYEHATNIIWVVNPPTKENAKEQLRLLNEPGHSAMSVKKAEELQKAFRAGRDSKKGGIL